jgi:6-pyruvoyltetrahydropterin/6-carboxytetrahydropterin synthase
MILSVIRKAQFNAAHRLYRKDWSNEQNDAVFGLCNNPNYHGHNYQLEVKITGSVNKETGYVIDLKDVKQYIDEEVMNAFDHKNLNLDTPEFKNLNPTAEYIAAVIWKKLRRRINKDLQLHIRLYETERNIVEYDGNGADAISW